MLIEFILVAVILTDAFGLLLNVGQLSVAGSTYIASTFNYISLFILIYIAVKTPKNSDTPLSIKTIYLLWLFINVFSLINGLFLAKDYWDWKFIFLNSISFSLISLVFFIGNSQYLAKISFNFVLKILFPFGFFLIPLTLVTNEQLYSRLMISVSMFMLFIPYLKFKWKLLIIIVTITSILMAFSFRTNLIKISFSLIFLGIYYCRFLFKPFLVIKFLRITFFVLPLILLSLGILEKFNFFSELQSNNKSGYTAIKNGQESDLFGDTRTFIYKEIFLSLSNSGHFVFGEGAAGKYKSQFFTDNDGWRGGSEVGILNILLYDGIVGVLIYFLLLFRVSFIAIYKSNNYLSKMLGLFIASRFLLSFIEEFTQYDINFYFFWIAIGLVSSTQFRAMSDQQLKTYFLFDGTKKSSRTPYLLQQED